MNYMNNEKKNRKWEIKSNMYGDGENDGVGDDDDEDDDGLNDEHHRKKKCALGRKFSCKSTWKKLI